MNGYVGARQERRDSLFDLLAASPDGLTLTAIADNLDCSLTTGRQAIRDLRMFCGSFDSVNLVNNPAGHLNGRHIYQLVGGWVDSRKWINGRLNDAETRLQTINAVTSSITRGTDGRSVEGKRARLISKVVGRLVEDLQEIPPGD